MPQNTKLKITLNYFQQKTASNKLRQIKKGNPTNLFFRQKNLRLLLHWRYGLCGCGGSGWFAFGEQIGIVLAHGVDDA